MTEKQKPSQLTNINQQIDALKKQISEGNANIKKYIEKRDKLHEQNRKAREEINQIKAERDALNEKVKALKAQRDAVRVLTAPIMEEINQINEKIEEVKKKLPRASHRDLQEQHDAIEWKISTTSLDLQEEKRLIEEVKAIEIQLSGYKKIDVLHKKIKGLYEHRKTFDVQADGYHKELTEVAKKSQDLHAVMMEKVNVMKRDKAEADGLHQSFIKTKEQNDAFYQQIRELIAQSTGIRVGLRDQYMSRKAEEVARRSQEEAKRKEEQAQRAVKEQEIKEKIGSQAKEKFNRGEKVDWQELALSLGSSDEDDEETQG